MHTLPILQWNRFDVYCSSRLVDCLLKLVINSAKRQMVTPGLSVMNRVDLWRSRNLSLIYCLREFFPAIVVSVCVASSSGSVAETAFDLASVKVSGMRNALSDPRMETPRPNMNGGHGLRAMRYALMGVASTSDRMTALERRKRAVALELSEQEIKPTNILCIHLFSGKHIRYHNQGNRRERHVAAANKPPHP